MADVKTLTNLPSDHWIHKALAKVGKKGGAKSPITAGKQPPMMPAKKPMAMASAGADDCGDHEYRD